MDKEAQEKIAELLYFDFEDYAKGTIAEMTWRDAPQARRDIWLSKASKVIVALEELGYCKLPDRPKLRENIELPLAMKLYKWFRNYPDVTEAELSELWEAEEQGFRNVILFRARGIISQILALIPELPKDEPPLSPSIRWAGE